MPLVVTSFSEDDIEAADVVLRAAFNTLYGRRDNLKRYLKLQSGGAFVARNENGVVGFGAAMDFGRFAYIGFMAVDPNVQRNGVGGLVLKTILEWLDARKCPLVLLDASPYGGPLYEKFGFIDSDLTLVLQRKRDVSPEKMSTGSIALTENEFANLVFYDSPHFAADRSLLLHSFFDDYPGRFLISRDARGLIDGYVVAQTRVIGPWVADNPEIAERLLHDALALLYEDNPTVFVSARNAQALDILSRYGFEKIRTQRHMFKGKPIQRERETSIFGQATLGFG